MMIVGVDPGLDGGIARLCLIEDAWVPITYPMPTYVDHGRKRQLVVERAKGCFLGADAIFIEQQQPMGPTVRGRKQGLATTARMMYNYGLLVGSALSMPHAKTHIITAREWKKAMGVTSDKATSIERAIELYPMANLFLTDRCKKPHDGMAEALLIAEYGRRRI